MRHLLLGLLQIIIALLITFSVSFYIFLVEAGETSIIPTEPGSSPVSVDTILKIVIPWATIIIVITLVMTGLNNVSHFLEQRKGSSSQESAEMNRHQE